MSQGRRYGESFEFMKISSFILALAAFFAIASAAHADYEIRISISSPDKPQSKEYVTKFKEGRIRTELDEDNAMISDQKTGMRMMLRTKTKQATDMSALMQSMQIDPAKDKPKPKPVPTGRKESVAGYEAEEFTYDLSDDTKISIWIAKNYPKDKAEVLMALYQASGSRAFATLPDLTALPGPIIRSVVKDKSGAMEIDSVIKSVTETTIDAKEFEVPADYTVKKLPARPAARKEAK
jgi:hypothetical protein